jgi:hypothetical protein
MIAEAVNRGLAVGFDWGAIGALMAFMIAVDP